MKTIIKYVSDLTGQEYESASECELFDTFERERRDALRTCLNEPFVQLNLGELLDRLEALTADQKKMPIRFDFGYFRPTGLHSWRGVYEHLAFGFNDKDDVKASHVAVWLQCAIGAEYEGYKGGHYTMHRQTPLWVANYGDSGYTIVSGFHCDEYHAIIRTAYRPYS